VAGLFAVKELLGHKGVKSGAEGQNSVYLSSLVTHNESDVFDAKMGKEVERISNSIFEKIKDQIREEEGRQYNSDNCPSPVSRLMRKCLIGKARSQHHAANPYKSFPKKCHPQITPCDR
jgi:hypothetical protein